MLSKLTKSVDRDVQAVLQKSLDGEELAFSDAMLLTAVRGRELRALTIVADELRSRHVGDDVTYVVNRNINFTNVCIKACHFCAFSRKIRAEDTYRLSVEAIVQRAVQAAEMGATEVCLQAGLAPDTDAEFYVGLVAAVREALPDIHLHALSPEEIKHGARQAGVTIRSFLTDLKRAGLGSLPGTSAEILDNTLRDQISPGRITTAEWLDVVRTAHDLGIATTSTMMFGHVETAAHRVRHMALLRDVQRETGGFTEFVPLSFVHEEAPLFVRQKVKGVAPGPTGNDVVRLYALARLLLGPSMRNIQASWVKEGLRMSQCLLDSGVNDLGGTLMNESISTTAGAAHGQLVSPAMLRHVIRTAGRTPVQRNTVYSEIRRFGALEDTDDEASEPLNHVQNPDETFGSYGALAADKSLRYAYPPRD